MAQSQPTSDQKAMSASFNIIRLALIGGTLFAGGAIWFIAQPTVEPVLGPELLPMVRWSVLAAFAAIALILFVVRQRWMAAETMSAKRSLNIVGWALAEGMALIGAFYLLFVGDPAFFIVGVLVQLIASFVIFPVPEE